jgi:hypothetical protein
MSTQVNIGDTIAHKNAAWRVVRIVQSASLHEGMPDPSSNVAHVNPPYVITETYFELRDVNGEVDFFVVASDKKDYEGEASNITPLPNLPWRKENVDA